MMLALAAWLAGCASVPHPDESELAPPLPPMAYDPADSAPLPPPMIRARSRWTPVRWAELPGFEQNNTNQAWYAWLQSCERPGPVFALLCDEGYCPIINERN